MKKILSIGLAVILSGVIVTQVMAFGSGYGKGTGQNMPAQITPEQSQKLAQFQKDVLPLRQQMLQLRTDLMVLRTQTTPDWNAIAAKQKEMINVRTEIKKKAADAGLAGIAPNTMMGKHGRKGMGKGMGLCE